MPAEHRQFNGIDIYLEYENLVQQSKSSDQSKDSKIPVVIQHGHGANHFFMKPVFDYLKSRGWPVIYFDWRGHGWSQKGLSGSYILDNCVEDLKNIFNEFIQNEYGYSQMDLFGHSMGGFLAMKYVLQFPHTVRKLILCATTPKIAWSRIISWGMHRQIKALKTNYQKSFIDNKKRHHIELGIENFPQWQDPTLMPDPQAVIEFLEDMIQYDVEKQLNNIQQPTYVCIGSKDVLKIGLKKWTAKIPHVTVETLNGYIHNITIHAKDILPQKIEAFLLSNII